MENVIRILIGNQMLVALRIVNHMELSYVRLIAEFAGQGNFLLAGFIFDLAPVSLSRPLRKVYRLL